MATFTKAHEVELGNLLAKQECDEQDILTFEEGLKQYGHNHHEYEDTKALQQQMRTNKWRDEVRQVDGRYARVCGDPSAAAQGLFDGAEAEVKAALGRILC